jgi:hypothetical protein
MSPELRGPTHRSAVARDPWQEQCKTLGYIHTEEQHCLGRMRDTVQKRGKLGVHVGPQKRWSFLDRSQPRHHATEALARNFSGTSSGVSRRTSQSSVIRFPAQR